MGGIHRFEIFWINLRLILRSVIYIYIYINNYIYLYIFIYFGNVLYR